MPADMMTMLMVGDIILDDDDAERLFDATREITRSADVTIGHVEVPHTLRGEQSVVGVPGSGGDPRRLEALSRAGFDVVTLAANHLFDYGAAGVRDTLDALHAQGIVTAGAGMNIHEARKPALIERNGVRIGVLSYNCVGPKESWASAGKPGAAYVHTMKHLDERDLYTFADPRTLRAMQDDIRVVRSQVEVLVVALHKGIVHTPVEVQDVEKQVSYAAVDAGADLVIGHHQHILRGIEFYRDRPIFHGLCNFVCVTDALSPDPSKNDSPERLLHAERRLKLYGFAPDPNYPKYAFHPEAKNSMMAVCDIGRDGRLSRVGFKPLWIEPDGQPIAPGESEKGREVASYIARISKAAGFETRFAWEAGRVLVLP